MTRNFMQYVQSVPDRTAIIAPDGTRISFRELAERANQVSHLLAATEYEKGDVVCSLLPNGPDALIVQRGVLRLPVYLSAINWHLTANEVAYILKDSRVRLFFATLAFEQTAREAMRIAGIAPEALVLVDAPPSDPHSLAARTAGLPMTLPPTTTSGSRRLYTSGTTGTPKAVRRPLSAITPAAASAAHVLRAGLYGVDHEDGIYLSTAPMYHAAPMAYADQALELGHTVVILPRWNAAEAAAMIEKHRVTWSYMVPLMFQELLALPEEERPDLSSLRGLVHTAAPCPPHVKRAMIAWLGPILTEIYGGTEGSATVIRSEDWLTHPGSVGQARPGVRIEIRDDEGALLAPSEIGNIYFENARESFVYDNDEQKTSSTRIDGAVTLGDIGYLDEDGFLYLCDRKADTVISGGVNIYPAEIEHALREISWVDDACVIGIADERWGESLHAVVVLGTGAPEESERATLLDAALREKIASYKVPRSFEYVDSLPYSEAGKMLRRQVRDERLRSSLVPQE